MVNDEFFAWTRLIALELIEYDRERGPKAELRLLEDEKAELSLKLHKIDMFFWKVFAFVFFSGECTALGLCVISCFLTITFAIVRRPLFADACVSNWLCCLSRKLAAMNSLYIYAQDPGSVTWRDSVWFWPHLCQEGEKEDIFEPPPNNVEASYTY